jgi:hypothetical protein
MTGFRVWPWRQRTITEYLRTDPEVRKLVAKMARAEVKNYLAELAEQSNLPFYGPAAFLRGLRIEAATWGASTSLPADTDEPYDPAADAPFNVIDTVTVHDAGGPLS